MTALPSDQNASGRSFGEEEVKYLQEVLESGCLFAPKGRFAKDFERDFASWLGSDFAVANSSGSASVHAAIAAVDPEPGEEIITSPITDMGALAPILYQGAIPVFADVDPSTGNVTAQTVEERVSDRTRAIVVTHLFGNPADVLGIQEVAARHGLRVIEDCAQAFGATVGDAKVGTLGEIGTFSLQQGKHITTGEGGITVTDDPALAKRMRLYVNKAWDYDEPSDHDFLALNYRISELQAAVALAQLGRLDENVVVRRSHAAILDETLSHLEGLTPVPVAPGSASSYWRYCLLVNTDVVPGGPDALAEKLRDIGIPSAPRYIKKPSYRTKIFADQVTFGQSRWPFSIARPEAIDYSDDLFPGTHEFLRSVLVLPWNEKWTTEHVDILSAGLASGVEAAGRDAA